MKISKQNKDLAMMALGVSAGDIAAGYVGNLVGKATFIPDAVKPYAPAAVQIAGGLLVATKVKNSLAKNAGVGMAAAGIKSLVASFIPGIAGFTPFDPSSQVAGSTYMVNVAQPEPYGENAQVVAGGQSFIQPANTEGTF